MLILFIAFIAASVGSLIAGFFGSGNGLVIVPILNHLLQVPAQYNMHVAIGTTLAFSIVSTMMATYSQHKKQAVIWPVFMRLLLPTIIGVIIGSLLSSQLNNQLLHIIFGIFVLALAGWSFFHKENSLNMWTRENWIFLFGGFLVAITVGLTGAGVLTIPYLRKYGLSIVQAIAMALALGMVTASVGTLSYITTGWSQPGLPSSCIGYIDWVLLIPLMMGGILFSKLGVTIAHRVSHAILHYLFCAFLIIIGIKMLWGI